MISKVLGRIGLPVLLKFVSSSLTGINSEIARKAELALDDVDTAIKEKQITSAQLEEANRHAEAMQKVESEYDIRTLNLINETIRSELASESRFISFWRPAFGYSVALAWILNMGTLCYVVIVGRDNAAEIINAMVETTSLWSVALGVLGISVVKSSRGRPQDKNSRLLKDFNK